MALHCNCGAELPENARFCLRCGKPQREEDQAPALVIGAPPAPTQAAAATAIPINFGNPAALRVALLCASASSLLNTIPVVSLGCCLWIVGAGFLAAYFYSRRTGWSLSVRNGARLGWITGVLTFMITIVLTAINLAIVRGSGSSVREILRQSMEKVSTQDEIARQVINFMTSPVGLAVFLVIYLGLGFAGMVGLAAAGGALGAKVMEKD